MSRSSKFSYASPGGQAGLGLGADDFFLRAERRVDDAVDRCVWGGEVARKAVVVGAAAMAARIRRMDCFMIE